MKKFNYFITPFIIFLLPIITYAECTEEEYNHFNKIKDKYKIEYKFDESKSHYILTLYNPESGHYTYEIQSVDKMPLTCEISNNSDTICNGIYPGGYNISVIGNTNTCNDTLKRTFLRLKPYNKYSEDPLCEGIKDFVLCQETYDKEIDYETFVSRVESYKEQKKEEKENNKKKIIDINKIKAYIEDNLYETIIIAVFVVLVIVTVIITIITAKKSRRLE